MEQLLDLGVVDDLLTDDDRRSLDEQGYLYVPNVLDSATVSAIAARFDELVAEEGERAGAEVHQEEGTERLSDLINKDPIFDVCWTHPKQLAAMNHVFNQRPFKLSSLNARSALPGSGHQGLHQDWFPENPAGDYQVCNTLWMIDDFTAGNGATRVVPGSHLRGCGPGADMDDPGAAHPDEIRITGPAGTMVVFNSHLWHGGTRNETTGPRRGVHGYFTLRVHGQQLIQRDYIRPATLERLSAAHCHLLDV